MIFKNFLKKKILITGLFFFLFQIVFSQEDSVINSLIEKNKQEELTKEEYQKVITHLANQKQYSNGLIYSKKLFNICKRTNDTATLVKAINLIAENLFDLGKVKEGIEFCEKENSCFREQDSIQLELLYFKWGMFYIKENEPQKAYEIYSKIKTERFKKLDLYTNNFSVIYAKLGYLDSAIYLLKNSLKSSPKDQISIKYQNIGYYLMNVHRYEEALLYFDTSLTFINKKEDYGYTKSFFTNKYHLYKRLGWIDEAYRMLDSINKYNELQFNRKLEEEIVELKHVYSRENKLKKKVETVGSKIEKYERRILLWTIIFLFLITIIVLIGFYRNIRSKNKLILLEKKLLQSQMTPHFIFNSLTVVQGMILNNENAKANKYLAKFSKLIRVILENSRNKLITLEEELSIVKTYVDLQNLQKEQPIEYEVSVSSELDLEELYIPPMLIQPFVENSIEHGFKGNIDTPKISIQIKEVDKKIICEILDNGIGLKQTNKESGKKSISTTITKERLAIISKEYKAKSKLIIENRKENLTTGTRVIIELPNQLK